jgi:leader peptidase (prepilin peptidase) / N-methyltransferase
LSHLPYILFVFAVGACVGSFLNVVIWRLPRGQSIVSPPSHCPKCDRKLNWFDNIPILAWIALRGRCRFCGEPISPRYPIVEAITALLFAFYYIMFYIVGAGPCPPNAPVPLIGDPIPLTRSPLSLPDTWPIYALDMVMIAGLLAASLIDAEQFIIPMQIPWVMAGVGVLVHAIVDRPNLAGALAVGPGPAAMAVGGLMVLAISLALL